MLQSLLKGVRSRKLTSESFLRTKRGRLELLGLAKVASRSATRPSCLLEITDKASALAFDVAAELILLSHETPKSEDDADDDDWHERDRAPQPAGNVTRTSQSLDQVFNEIYSESPRVEVIVVKTPDK